MNSEIIGRGIGDLSDTRDVSLNPVQSNQRKKLC